jgi:hypothetical protein
VYASIKIIRPPITKAFLRKIYVWIIIVRINIMKGAKKKIDRYTDNRRMNNLQEFG